MANLPEAKDRFIEEAVTSTQNFLLSRHQKLNWQDHLFVSRNTLHLVDKEEYERLHSQLGRDGAGLSRCGRILIDIKPGARVDYYGNVDDYWIDSDNEAVRATYSTILSAELIGSMMPFIAKVTVPKVPENVFNVMVNKLTQDLPPATGMPVKTFRRFKEHKLRPEDCSLVGTGCRLVWSFGSRDPVGYSVQMGESFDRLVCCVLSSELTSQFIHKSIPNIKAAEQLLASEQSFVRPVKKKLAKLSFSFNPAVSEGNNSFVGYVEGYMLNRLLREISRRNGKLTLEEYLNPSFLF